MSEPVLFGCAILSLPHPPSSFLKVKCYSPCSRTKAQSTGLHANDFQVWPLPLAWPNSFWCCTGWLRGKYTWREARSGQEGPALGNSGAWQDPSRPGSTVAEEVCAQFQGGVAPLLFISLFHTQPTVAQHAAVLLQEEWRGDLCQAPSSMCPALPSLLPTQVHYCKTLW